MADKPIVLQQVFPLWQAQSPAAELEVTHVDLHPERRTVSVRLQGREAYLNQETLQTAQQGLEAAYHLQRVRLHVD